MASLYKSKYFSLHELCKTSQKGIVNTPHDFKCIENLACLCQVLDSMRVCLERPIFITSGYRSQELNRIVNGASGSWHIFGCAADVKLSDGKTKPIWSWLSNYFGFNNHCEFFEDSKVELKLYSTWVHIAVKPGWLSPIV